jgi:hypothetical protein
VDQYTADEVLVPVAGLCGKRALVVNDDMIRTVWKFGGYADGGRRSGHRRGRKRRAYPGMWRALFVMLDLARGTRDPLRYWRMVIGLALVAHVRRVAAPPVVPTPAWSGIRSPQCAGAVSTPARGSPRRLHVGEAPT